jgi:spore coat polysaccharide biosynthesis protein SpsF
LQDLAGRPMLAQQIRRLRQCATADEIVVATTDKPDDDPVVELARREGVAWFRGSETDVLGRFVGAAAQSRAEVVVRTTADCPLIDPQVTDVVIRALTDHPAECDYASNGLRRTYPRGLDVEAMFVDVLHRLDRLARSPRDREHVTVLVRGGRPELFLCRSVEDTEDNADLRWTVDQPVDLDLVRRLYGDLDLGTRIAPYPEMVAHVRSHPELATMNAGTETWDPVAQ